MKFIILFCLLGAALALFDDKWKMKNDKNVVSDDKNAVRRLCIRDSDCSALCKLSCNPMHYDGELCKRANCYCRVRPMRKH